MRKRQKSVEWTLKRLMFLTGMVLGLSLAGKFFRVWELKEGNRIWQESGEEWLAKGLALWVRNSYPAGEETAVWQSSPNWSAGTDTGIGWTEWAARELFVWLGKQSPFLCFGEVQGETQKEPLDEDPSYSHYLAGRRVMKESSYMLLFGDENSQVQSQEDYGEKQTGGQDAKAMDVEEMARLTPAYHIRKQPVTGTKYVMEQLADYDFLMKYFYSVHASTTARREEMNAEKLLGIDLSLEKEPGMPQILIYHTHSQETYADYGPDQPEATVVGIGNYLTQLLEQKGYGVIHDTTVYDVIHGELDRNHAYNYALEGITGILQRNPSVEVVLDLHRDGVKEGLHMVSEVNGKSTAPIMFFNGMSQTPEGPIEYLQNPYKEENLAFSLQMQLDAAAYFPGLTRKIYLKGLRYNLHLRPRSALVEVGAQTNTYDEARNAMEPLAELVDMVLTGECIAE